MPDINITVRDKIAKAEGSPEIVCGNSDYAVVFDLDSEWDTYDLKTMRVVWIDILTGTPRYNDVPFSGNSAIIPAVYNAYEIAVGIYAGDIRTTTPARIPCDRCITDGSVVHETPSASVYEQIIDLLEKMAHPVGFGATGDSTPIIDGFNLAMVGDMEQRIPFNGWNYWQETNGDAKTSSTVTASPTADCLLLACVMHRNENVSISGDGWTKIVDSVMATSDADTSQWITVWGKPVQKGQHEVTVEQSASVRMSLKLIALYDASAVTVVTNSLINDNPYTPAVLAGKRRLYLISSVYANNSIDETYIATDTGDLDLRKANEKRFVAFYYYEPDKSATPKFKYNLDDFAAGRQNIIILDIEEVE